VEETLYIVSGRGRQMVEDADGMPTYRDVAAGDMVHVPISAYHETINTGWEPLKIVATYAPHGPEAFLRALPDVRILPPGELPR
jgi:oxalate decarboxylase/phosphoglucose isomerase-like protein (cupin superfamily)